MSFFIAFVITGVLTRVLYYFFSKRFKKLPSVYYSFGVVFLLLPLFVFFIEWDKILSDYVLSMLAWFFVDLLHRS